MTDSLNASTESNHGVTPNQRSQETVEERLRRLTKEAVGGGQHNGFGPKHSYAGGPPHPQLGNNLGVPGAAASSGPDSVLHRIVREATQTKKY